MRSVLVADPDREVREILRTYLEAQGISVHEVPGVRCIGATKRTKPDLVIMALSPRYEVGLRTVRRLKSNVRTASVPVVVFTASGTPDVLDAARAAGCSLALAKPMPPSKLFEAIKGDLLR